MPILQSISTSQRNANLRLRPKLVPNQHFLSKATFKAAKDFELGDNKLNIEFDRTIPQYAIVNEFKLLAPASRKLGRKENIVEGIASAIDQTTSDLKLVKDYLKRVKVDDNITDNSQFYFISLRRRNPIGFGRGTIGAINPADLLRLTKELPISSEQNFILALSKDKKNNLIATIIHSKFKGKKAGASIIKVSGFEAQDETTQIENPPHVVEHNADPDEDTQDFANCYSTCMNNVPDYMLSIVGGICGACVGTIAATAGTAGAASPALIVACTGCAVALGLVFGNCLLTCHEML